MNQEFLTVNDIAKMLKVQPDKVRGFVHRKELKASNIGAKSTRPRWIIARADFEAFLDARSNQQPAKKKPTRKRTPAKEYV